jgi:hypothetical protein
VSNLNVGAGRTVANLAKVAVAGGKVNIYNWKGSVNVIADLAGYYAPTAAADFVAQAPKRVLDTRTGNGTGGVKARLGEGQVLTLTIPGLPANATAATLNLTAADGTSSTFLTAYPAGQSRPNVSNLNVGAGRTVANLATVKVVDGKVSIYNWKGSVSVIADLAGYYVP